MSRGRHEHAFTLRTHGRPEGPDERAIVSRDLMPNPAHREGPASNHIRSERKHVGDHYDPAPKPIREKARGPAAFEEAKTGTSPIEPVDRPRLTRETTQLRAQTRDGPTLARQPGKARRAPGEKDREPSALTSGLGEKITNRPASPQAPGTRQWMFALLPVHPPRKGPGRVLRRDDERPHPCTRGAGPLDCAPGCTRGLSPAEHRVSATNLGDPSAQRPFGLQLSQGRPPKSPHLTQLDELGTHGN